MMRKKIATFIFIAMLFCSLFHPFQVKAQEGIQQEFSPGTFHLSAPSTIKQGEFFQVIIKYVANKPQGLYAFDVLLDYDAAEIEFIRVEKTGEFHKEGTGFDYKHEKGSIQMIGTQTKDSVVKQNGDIVIITFQAFSDAADKTQIILKEETKLASIASDELDMEYILGKDQIVDITILQSKDTSQEDTEDGSSSSTQEKIQNELKKAEKLLEEDVQKAAEALLGILNKATGTLSKGEQEEIRKVATEVIQQLQSISPKIITEEGKAIAKVDAAFLTKNMEIATKLLEKVKAKGITVPETNILTVAMKEEKSSEIQFQKEVLTFMDQHNNHVQVQFPNIKVTFAPNAIEYDDTDQILLQMTPMKKGEIKTNNITYTDYNTYDIDMVRVIGKQRSKINQFNKKVELQLHYQASPLEEEKLGLYYYNEEKQSWEYIKQGKQDKQNKYFTVSLEQLGSYGIFHYAKDYVDLDQTYTEARYAIEVLTAKHMIKGVDDSHYAPNQSVTRAEFATLLVNAMDFSLKQYQGVFQDVQGTAWYAPYVQTAYEAGLIQGQGEGKYNPQGKITREEMAVMIARAYEYKGKEATLATDGFTDEGEISSWAKEVARKMKAEGLIKGVGNNNFAPKKDTLRSDAAVMMYRLINGFEVQ